MNFGWSLTNFGRSVTGDRPFGPYFESWINHGMHFHQIAPVDTSIQRSEIADLTFWSSEPLVDMIY